MKRVHGRFEFETTYVEDRRDGWGGFDLYRVEGGKKMRVARVVFWDAAGEFVLETFGGDVPLAVIEELIREAKRVIKVS
ncbi:MAG: hypothetical protein FJ091_16880 [Deltaproteobacteria bacterium]|nr:hypothetical protein [Deltaproteobacteria bacterium]